MSEANPTTPVFQMSAPAKLTWSLEVTGRRSDGFHELRSEMVSLALADVVTIDESSNYLRVDGPSYVRLSHWGKSENNLITRALALASRTAGVAVAKMIPIGGGLGGGSSDAAAILRWAGILDVDVAMQLGSDVPFCLHGGRCLVTGVGDVLEPLPFEHRDVTLIVPPFGINTSACYAAYDALVARGTVPTGRNHLEGAARRVEPRLDRVMTWLGQYAKREVYLAGSGSTMFVEGHLREGASHWTEHSPEGLLTFLPTSTTPALG